MTKNLTPEQFYDALASDYDTMTGFDNRFSKEHFPYKQIVDRYQITTAIDAGAGTGFHSILLAMLGVSVTALDCSQAMLTKLLEHARQRNVTVTTHHCNFEDSALAASLPVDALFCLGNGIAHATSLEHLTTILDAFRRAVRPGGLIMLQLLNYTRILAERSTTLNVREVESKRFSRSYDYCGGSLRFNIEIQDTSQATSNGQHLSVPLFPLQEMQIKGVLNNLGLLKHHSFGNISLIPFEPASSQDLVLLIENT